MILAAVIGGVSVFAIVGGWIGFRVPPPLLPFDDDSKNNTTDLTEQKTTYIEIPDDLPAPVVRYLRTAAAAGGAHLPKVDSMVACGSAWGNFGGGMWLPMRYRLVHRPGVAFERYMEITWFGIPIMKAIDRFVNGQGMTGPVGSAATGPNIDQGSNMVLFAESPLMPSLLVDDKRLRWEAVDDTMAKLFFPFEGGEDELHVYFDQETSLISCMTGLRYKGLAAEKVLWRCNFVSWQDVNGAKLPARVAITWEDDGKPWSYWDFQKVAWNVDISETIATWKTQ
jgi:hypothetical protein